MPAVNVAVVRLIFRSIYAAATTAPATTLQSELLATALATVPQILTGKQVTEVESSGVSTKYQIPTNIPLADVAAVMERLMTLYELSLQPTTNTPPGAGLTGGIGENDSAIYAWMMGQLAVVRSFAIDHTNPNFRP